MAALGTGFTLGVHNVSLILLLLMSFLANDIAKYCSELFIQIGLVGSLGQNSKFSLVLFVYLLVSTCLGILL